VPRPGPEAAVHHPPGARGIGAEARELEVAQALEREADGEERRAERVEGAERRDARR
jgi:hypothetical protein